MNLKEKIAQQKEQLYPQSFPSQESSLPANVIPLNQKTAEDSYLPEMVVSIEEARQRIELLQAFIKEMMQEGTDYGRIPGVPKPSLLKPGAEKLAEIYNLAKYVEVLQRTENWEGGIFAYEIKVSLVNKKTGLTEAEGIGSCNSREKKYAVQDPYSIINTILKMAKKRALVDAVLSATRSSDLFTQDIEDMEPGSLQATTDKKTGAVIKPFSPATQAQRYKIQQLTRSLNMEADDFHDMLATFYKVQHLEELSKQQASKFIEQLLDISKS